MTQISIEQVRDVLRLVDYFENIPQNEWADAEQKAALDYALATGLIDSSGRITDAGREQIMISYSRTKRSGQK